MPWPPFLIATVLVEVWTVIYGRRRISSATRFAISPAAGAVIASSVIAVAIDVAREIGRREEQLSPLK